MKRKHCSEITKMSKSPINVDEVRTLMLSLLLSHKGAMPLHKLEKDFFQEDQRYIPYLEFGHSSLLGFLQSMPEHFVVEQYSGNYYVRGIPSDKSKHVDSLVARQKVNMKHPKYVPPRFRQSFNPQTYHGYRTKPHQKAVIESNNLLALTEFIKNNPNGVSLQNALIFVRRKAPFIHISVQELRSQLQLLSHCLYLDGNMVYPIWNNLPNTGYQQPVIKKPLSQNKVLNDLGSLPIKQTECPAGQEDLDTQECFSDDNDFMLPDSINCQRWNELNDEQLATNHVEYANCEQSDTFNNAKVMNNDINKDYTPINSKNNIDMKKYLDVSEIVSDRIKCRLEELIRKHPEGIWCAQLPDLYLQEYKVPLNYNQLGFTSVREFTSYLPKIFYMEQVNKTDDFLLYSADKRPIVPKTESIDITQTRHNQYDEHNSMQARSSTDNDEDNGPIPSNIPPAITKIFAPKNVMNYNDNVEKILVTECNKKRYLEVYVVEVFHPNFFWIQLRENKRRFNKMMDELSEFYEYSNHLYTIARIALKKDMNCACVYMSRWHRAIIKTVKPDYRVTVFFYDYGTLKTYEPEDIYYLHKKFSSLPAQAIPCGLFNVKPCNSDRWKKSVVDQFIDKIADTLLAATIKSLDDESNSMMVILTDTSEEEDVHINEWLVKEKLAQYSKTVRMNDISHLKFDPIKSVNADSAVNIYESQYNSNQSILRDERTHRLSDVKSEDNENKVKFLHNSPNRIKVIEQKGRNKLSNGESSRTTSPSAKSLDAESPDAKILDAKSQSTNYSLNGESETSRELYRKILSEKIRRLNRKSNSNQSTSTFETSTSDENNASQTDLNRTEESKNNKKDNNCNMNFSFRNSDDEDDTKDFGTFRSLYGGHGLMEPIDWSVIREEKPHKTVTTVSNDDASIGECESSDVENKVSHNEENEIPNEHFVQYFLNMTRREEENFLPENEIVYDVENINKIPDILETLRDKTIPDHTITVMFTPNIDDGQQHSLNQSLKSDSSITSNVDTKQHHSDSIASSYNVNDSNYQLNTVDQMTLDVPGIMQQILKIVQNTESNTELDSDDLSSSRESLNDDKFDESKGDDESVKSDCASETFKSTNDDANVTETVTEAFIPIYNDCDIESDNESEWDAYVGSEDFSFLHRALPSK